MEILKDTSLMSVKELVRDGIKKYHAKLIIKRLNSTNASIPNYTEKSSGEHPIKFAIKSRSSQFYLDGRGGDANPLITNRPPKGDKFLQWYIIPTKDGYFALKSVSSGRFLDGRNPEHQDPLMTDRPYEGDAYLHWSLVAVDDGYFSIKSRSGGRYLDGRNQSYQDPLLTNRNPQGDQFLQWSIIFLNEQV